MKKKAKPKEKEQKVESSGRRWVHCPRRAAAAARKMREIWKQAAIDRELADNRSEMQNELERTTYRRREKSTNKTPKQQRAIHVEPIWLLVRSLSHRDPFHIDEGAAIVRRNQV